MRASKLWERENLRVLEWVSRGIFLLCVSFFPVRIFLFKCELWCKGHQIVRVCMWKRDREEVHCCPFSLCTVELSMIHWWSFQCGAITELLPISTPPLLSSWLWEWSMLGDSRTVYVGGSAQGPALWDLMHVIQISVIREFRGRAVRVCVWMCAEGAAVVCAPYTKAADPLWQMPQSRPSSQEVIHIAICLSQPLCGLLWAGVNLLLDRTHAALPLVLQLYLPLFSQNPEL